MRRLTKRQREVLQLCGETFSPGPTHIAFLLGQKYHGSVMRTVHRLQEMKLLDSQRRLTDLGKHAR